MFSKVVRTAPRLFISPAKLNYVPICLQSSSAGKVIESYYKPSGNVPKSEDYHQIPIVIDGEEHPGDPTTMRRVYPLVPSLEDISIEKDYNQVTEDGKEIEPEFQIKTLEDKLKVWFGEEMPTKYDEQKPERDHVNYPRLPYAQWDIPNTRMYFLPESWFKFFESKTGRLGGYVFGTTFLTFLVSKEIFVYGANAHPGLALAGIGFIVIKFYGKQINRMLTANVDKEHQGWRDWQEGMKNLLKDHVKELKKVEDRSINPELIYDAKRENLHLQQEAEYRRRLMQVYNEVKRKLDYQVAIEDAKKNYTRRHFVNWVIDNVNKNINAELEKAVLKQCVVDLKDLSVKRKNAI